MVLFASQQFCLIHFSVFVLTFSLSLNFFLSLAIYRYRSLFHSQRVVTSLGAQAAAIRPRGEIDQFVRALGRDGISHATIPRAEYAIPPELVELDAEIHSADAAAGIRRKVYGNSGGSGGAAGGGGSGVAMAVAAAAKKEVLTIDSLARVEQLADQANANAPPPPSIPRAFAALTEAIRPNLGVEGIFRISAGATELAALRTQVCVSAGSVSINCRRLYFPQVGRPV